MQTFIQPYNLNNRNRHKKHLPTIETARCMVFTQIQQYNFLINEGSLKYNYFLSHQLLSFCSCLYENGDNLKQQEKLRNVKIFC